MVLFTRGEVSGGANRLGERNRLELIEMMYKIEYIACYVRP